MDKWLIWNVERKRSRRPRNLEIVQLRKKNFSLEEIGKRYNLTSERVRQILLKKGITGIFPRPKHMTVFCAYCSKNIRIRAQKVEPKSEKIFCTKKHRKLWLKEHLVIRACELLCGKEFIINLLAQHQNRFCSKKCAAVWRTLHMKVADTSIEIKVEKWLKELNIVYEKQKVIPEGKTVVDFYIPTQRLVIYADGDYWHSLPVSKKRDYLQNCSLKQGNYKVLRLKEKDINNRKALFLLKEALRTP